MTVRIEIHQARTVEVGPLYRVTTTVISASGIDRKIFVFSVDTQEFEHVATTWDMENVSDSRDTAITNSESFYRGDGVIVNFPVEQTALESAVYTRARVEFLATQYDLMQTEFVGSGDYIYTGE